MSDSFRSAVALHVLWVLAAGTAAAQNYILNAHLHENALSWQAEPQAAAHRSTEDAEGDLDSGSLEVSNSHADPHSGQGVTQCLPLVPIPGTMYGFGARVKILPGQIRSGSVMIGPRFHDQANCRGNVVGTQPRKTTQTVGSWVTLTKSGLEIPENALSVLFLAFPVKVDGGGTLAARFDDLYLQMSLPFAGGFDNGDASAWTKQFPAVITEVPYVDRNKIQGVSRVFCQSGHCPWPPHDALHDGYDFTPTEDLVAFQAACDGTVAAVELFANRITDNYQVNVMFECDADDNHGLVYAFEPISKNVAVGNQQVDHIAVQVGDSVKVGELIGRLLRHDPSGAHVHYGVYLKGPVGQICPGDLFASSVHSDLLDLVRTDHPGWNLCH